MNKNINKIDEEYTKAKFYNEHNILLPVHAKNIEQCTQYLIKKYITSDMKVLELGCRYGTASFFLDRILTDPKKQLLCVDADYKIEECLKKNHSINNCTFNILIGTVSSKDKLYIVDNSCCWENKTYDIPHPKFKTTEIKTYTLDVVKKMYNIDFNVLVADCEGFLLEFMEDNMNFIRNLNIIIYEEDCGINHPINDDYIDYGKVENILKNFNFECVETITDKIELANKVWIKK